jgi:hypothetical protein
MDACILRPPTNRPLGDNVLGGVRQRSSAFGAYSFVHVDHRATGRTPTDEFHPAGVRRHYGSPGSLSAVDEPISPVDRKRKRQEPTSAGNSKLMLLAVSSGDVQPRLAKKDPESLMKEIVSQDWFIAQQNHQREVRRTRQIRYRKKQQHYVESLAAGNRQLEQDIKALQKRQRAISSAVPTEKTAWSVAVEYFRLFQFGLRVSEVSKRANAASEAKPSVQLDFLRATMAPDVLYNAGRGVESIMRNWQYFSLWFKDVELELDGLKRSGMDSLIAKTTTRFTITERTLSTVFPHLCGEAANDAYAGLADKLRGKTLVMRGSMRFDWDSGYGRVASVTSESDMLTPMLKLLGSLEDVSKVFEKSLISLTPYRGQAQQKK